MSVKHSLVVPCFNEEGNVENFFKKATEEMKEYTDSYEIVFVNDGSSDSTCEKLKDIYKLNKNVNVKVINFSRNFGKEAAMYAGLTHSSGEYVTVIDADLQQDPKYAVQMAKILDENSDCDMVAAFQSERKEGKLISFLKKTFYKTINRFSDVDFISDASDFRTMRRSVVDTIVALPEYHRFSKGIFSWVGYNTMSIPYEVKEREHGETKWNFKKLLKYAFDGIMAYTDLPLKLPFYISFCLFAVSLILFAALIILDFVAPDLKVSSGYIYLAVLIIGAVLSFSQGILGSYIGKIHTQTKNRPIFIAKEILTYEQNNESDN